MSALVAATALDGGAYHTLVMPDAYDRDCGRMFRIVGFLPTWAIVFTAPAVVGHWTLRPGSSPE